MQKLLSSLFGGLLVANFASSQQLAATAVGQLSAISSTAAQSWGPAAIPATQVSAVAQSFVGLARATARLSDSALDVALDAADSGYTSASIALTLNAPVDAGVRVRLQLTQTSPYPSLTSLNVSALGQARLPGPFGVIEFDALAPVGGLVVQIDSSLSVLPFVFHSLAYTVTWSCPGVAVVGEPTPGCLGDAVAWTRGIPQLGSASFGITCVNTHPFLGAVSAIGFGGLAAPVPYDGVDVWLDPALPIVTMYVPGGASGNLLHLLALPTHASFLGFTLFSQFLVFEPHGCMPLGLSGSNAVRWTIQP